VLGNGVGVSVTRCHKCGGKVEQLGVLARF